MRKLSIVVLVLFALAQFLNNVSAQSQFSIGVKVAANGSNYKDLTKSKCGIDAGVFMRFGTNFFFQPEVNYAFKSSTFKDVINEISTNSNLKQHFISVPALLGYHFINRDNFKFRLTLGPRFDFKLKDNIEGSNWETNSLIWGGQVGVGIDCWRFTLDLNYCLAADNFHNSEKSSSETHRSNIFSTSLGFKFIK